MALRRYLRRGGSTAWDDVSRRAPTEFRESGEDVFVAFAMHGRGRGSGVEVDKGGFPGMAPSVMAG